MGMALSTHRDVDTASSFGQPHPSVEMFTFKPRD